VTMEFTTCPECGELAQIRSHEALESTGGPFEHLRIICLNRHWFFLPESSLRSARQPVVAHDR
jgi:hypothetical protein